MLFEEVLPLIRKGCAVQRESWNGTRYWKWDDKEKCVMEWDEQYLMHIPIVDFPEDDVFANDWSIKKEGSK